MRRATDPCQPLERRFDLAHAHLQVLAEARNPAVIITKNELVLRDADLLAEMANDSLVAIYVSLLTVNADLSGALEPRTSRPPRRLRAMKLLSVRGIPVMTLVTPVVPELTDYEKPRILEQATAAGATHAEFVALRLPLTVTLLFEVWLQAHRLASATNLLQRIRQIRGGRWEAIAVRMIQHTLHRRAAWHISKFYLSRLSEGKLPDSDFSPELDDVTETSEPPMLKVIMHNDHYTTMEFVVDVLESVFMKTPSEAMQIMLAIHRRGQGLCGTFTREIAETKVERVHTLARQSEFPLRCSVEQA